MITFSLWVSIPWSTYFSDWKSYFSLFSDPFTQEVVFIRLKSYSLHLYFLLFIQATGMNVSCFVGQLRHTFDFFSPTARKGNKSILFFLIPFLGNENSPLLSLSPSVSLSVFTFSSPPLSVKMKNHHQTQSDSPGWIDVSRVEHSFLISFCKRIHGWWMNGERLLDRETEDEQRKRQW